MSDWHCFDDRDALDTALAAHLADALTADIAARDRASIALSGGITPRGMLRALAQQPLAWSQVDVTLVDERWVDPGSADSNERLVRENLLHGTAAAAQFHGLYTGAATPQAGVDEVRQRLAAMAWPLSAVLLGMGADGHTASWFPGAANLPALLDAGGGSRALATESVSAPHARMTLTLAAVLDSRQVLLHITGDGKRRVLEQAVARNYPVAAVLRQATTPLSIWWAP